MVREYHILIAEDEPMLLQMLIRLTQRCYPIAQVLGFNRGASALQAFNAAGADFLITNYRMPGMDGATLVRALRARGVAIPILGLSGHPANAAAMRAAGVTAYLDNPFTLAAFQMAVYTLLPP